MSARGGTEEVVIADRESRTVFGNYASFHAGERQWNDPQPDDIADADIVCLDPYFREQSLRAAELCVEQRTPYVTLDCPYDGFTAQLAAAVAACVCLTVPHTLNAPGLDAILAFMEEHRPASRTEVPPACAIRGDSSA